MPHPVGFDNKVYISEQSARIRRRMGQFEKLYLEFGGKLFDDYHAARVLPGFDLNGKVKLLSELRDSAEIILCISAKAIEKNKTRSDIGITYDMDVLRLIDALRKIGLYIGAVVITQFTGQPSADTFRKQLEIRGERVYMPRYVDPAESLNSSVTIRHVPPVSDVYEKEGLPPAKSVDELPPGERRFLEEAGLLEGIRLREKVRTIRTPKKSSRNSG